jgi:hypothetical protein
MIKNNIKTHLLMWVFLIIFNNIMEKKIKIVESFGGCKLKYKANLLRIPLQNQFRGIVIIEKNYSF